MSYSEFAAQLAVGDDFARIQGAASFLKGVAVPAAQRLVGLGARKSVRTNGCPNLERN